MPYDISLVVPCHNEEGNVAALHEEALRVFSEAGFSVEFVFVDDGSADGTLSRLEELAAGNPTTERSRIQVVSFSRNFGKESAIFAGLKAAQGACIGLIDADLQQDPAIARDMLRYLIEHDDCDMVAAYQDRRNEPPSLKLFKEAFYRVFNAASDEIDIPADMSDFRVFRRIVAEALVGMPEYFRFSKGLFAWVGFRTHPFPYTARPRLSGKSNWSFRSLFRYAMSGILSFTTWPLKVSKHLGLISSTAAMLYLLYVVIFEYLIMGVSIPGYPTVVCLILLFGGIQLFVLGIIGEYLARAYTQGKGRPIYLARRTFTSDRER